MSGIHKSDLIGAKNIWQRKRILIFLGALVAVLVISFLIWWVVFRSYVTTNDALVATNILQVAPVGVGGKIEKVLVDEGDFVTAGQPLVEIDHRVAEAQVQKARARFDLGQVEMGRVRSMYQNRLISKRELDKAAADYAVAEAELQLAELNLENTFLKSPVDGVVIKRDARPGNLLEPGQEALIISDVDHAWVSANIEETKIGRVRPGQKVTITVDEGGRLTGHVLEVTASTAAQFSLIPSENAAGNFTKVVQRIPVKIILDPHPRRRILRAGQSVTIRIKVK